MTVKVAWVQKKRGDNHLPRFRPTDSDALDAKEKRINDAILETMGKVPEDFYRRYIFNEVNEARALESLIEELTPEQDKIAVAIFAVYVQAADDMAHRLRDSINRELRRLKSNARLQGSRETNKAFDYLPWEPFTYDPTIPPLQLFNQQPDNMSGKVFARFRAGEIISSVASDVQANIEAVIAEGFTAQQTFTTGRTVTGLTPEQTARRLFFILQEVSPVPITGADYAAQVVPYTNGLFPRWAVAVDRSMNSYANRLANQGINPREIERRTKGHGERYGNKLRRARARMIARTEVAYAQNQAMYDVMLSAQNDGLVGTQTLKEWITGPTDVCDICTPMGGTRVPLKQNFSWQGGQGLYPPAHPNCRCYTDMIPQYTQPPTRLGTGQTGDPYRYQFPDGWQIGVPVN